MLVRIFQKGELLKGFTKHYSVVAHTFHNRKHIYVLSIPSVHLLDFWKPYGRMAYCKWLLSPRSNTYNQFSRH